MKYRQQQCSVKDYTSAHVHHTRSQCIRCGQCGTDSGIVGNPESSAKRVTYDVTLTLQIYKQTVVATKHGAEEYRM